MSKAAAKDIREAFGQMAMNDEETVALIAGGHSFGKAHGAVDPSKCVGAAPAGAHLEEQGFGWTSKCGTGSGKDAVTSGLEGAWTSTPARFSNDYLSNLFSHEWVQTKSAAGATQWTPKDGKGAGTVPDAHDKTKSHAPMIFTTDLALKVDASYQKIAKRFLDNPKEFEAAFAKAWFKLTHRDMGPRARYLGSEVPRTSEAARTVVAFALLRRRTGRCHAQDEGSTSGVPPARRRSSRLLPGHDAWVVLSPFRE